MDIALIILIVAYALYAAYKFPQKQLFFGLLATLAVGIGDFIYVIQKSSTKVCGSLFNPDIGCAAAVPNWLIFIGASLGVIAILLSLLIIGLSIYRRKKHKA